MTIGRRFCHSFTASIAGTVSPHLRTRGKRYTTTNSRSLQVTFFSTTNNITTTSLPSLSFVRRHTYSLLNPSSCKTHLQPRRQPSGNLHLGSFKRRGRSQRSQRPEENNFCQPSISRIPRRLVSTLVRTGLASSRTWNLDGQ